MKLPHLNLASAGILLAAGLLFSGCKKQVEEAIETEAVVAAAIDDTEASIVFEGVYNDVSGVNDDIGIVNGEPGSFDPPPGGNPTRCYTITINKLTANDFPVRVTIDFGAGCLGRDGKLRKGQVITDFTNRLRVPGARATTTFNGFSVNAVSVSGIHTIINNSTSATRIFTRTVENGMLSQINGNYVLWNATHTNTQVDGLGTPNFHWDDAFTITGSSSGQNSRNSKVIEWSRTILEPLFKKTNCRWIAKGEISITHQSRTAVLNFGNGNCDRNATITFNGHTKDILLP